MGEVQLCRFSRATCAGPYQGGEKANAKPELPHEFTLDYSLMRKSGDYLSLNTVRFMAVFIRLKQNIIGHEAKFEFSKSLGFRKGAETTMTDVGGRPCAR